ncbi:hypothetical protein CFC21_072572, partial [Triticum aestivum]|uniref:Iron-binding zinc finger CDGSH type domain-containing protein n=2 Tax=Triticum aestivum TaxID=4565 RepID=A0A3B6LQ59_WHEAT
AIQKLVSRSRRTRAERFGVGRRFAGRIDRRGRSASACARHTPQILPHAATPTQANGRSIHPQLPPNQSDQPQETPPAAATKNHPWRPCSARPQPPRAVSPSRLPRRRRRQALAAVGPDGAWWRCVAEADTAAAGSGINPAIRKEEAKVVDTVLAGELSKPLTPYCRCWRSGTFPLCDGSHVKHNKATGDNVGPLLVKK